MMAFAQTLKKIASASALATVMALPGYAAISLDIIKAADENGNGDGRINPGAEVESLSQYYPEMDDVQQSAFDRASLTENPDGGVPIEDFSAEARDAAIAAACKKSEEKALFLRDRIVNTSLVKSDIRQNAGEQATFSVTRFNQTGDWTWNLNGVLTAVPFRSTCLLPEDWSVEQVSLYGAAIAPFVAFSGKGQSGKPSQSALLFGITTEAHLVGGRLFDEQNFKFSPSYQTDFDFDAQIYRFSAGWYPVNTSVHLGAYVGASENLKYWWTVGASADFLSVNKPGRTNYAAGEQYAWLDASIGAHVEYSLNNAMQTIYADAEMYFAHDVANHVSANLFTFDAGIFLDEDRNTSLALKYINGTDFDTFVKKDQVTLTLGVRF